MLLIRFMYRLSPASYLGVSDVVIIIMCYRVRCLFFVFLCIVSCVMFLCSFSVSCSALSFFVKSYVFCIISACLCVVLSLCVMLLLISNFCY